MSDQTQDTIFALSSGALPSGVAVVRISGPETGSVLEKMTGGLPEPRRARLSDIRRADGMPLDRGLSLFFPGPASFTGEDCGELHLHGGRAVVTAVLEALSSTPGLRMAEPGEFTKRAFLNGKVDLTGAEALSDLIAAETEAQRRFALSNSSEAHRRLYSGWRQQLVRARAMIEAELDFADEGDVPGSVADSVWADVKSLRAAVAAHLSSYKDAEIIREGLRVVILGAPNAGKSSLLNALARREVAIVTEVPGTTRDVLEVNLDIGGVKVIVADTAGIRETEERVELVGVELALQRARESDLVLLVEDVSAPVPFSGIPEGKSVIRIGNKADLVQGGCAGEHYDCVISARSGKGIDQLLDSLGEICAKYVDRATDTLPFRARHLALLRDSIAALDAAMIESEGLELRAENLRVASQALGRIHGEIDVEDLLDAIFSTFCIGK